MTSARRASGTSPTANTALPAERRFRPGVGGLLRFGLVTGIIWVAGFLDLFVSDRERLDRATALVLEAVVA